MNVSSVNPSGRPTSRPTRASPIGSLPYTAGWLVAWSLDVVGRDDRRGAAPAREVRRTFTCCGGGAGAAVMNSRADDSGQGVGASTPPASGTIRNAANATT